MTPDQKQALTLREQGKSRAEIAASMGKSETAIKSLLERARKWVEMPKGQRDAISSAGLDVSTAKYGWRIVPREDGGKDSVFWKADIDNSQESIVQSIASAFENIPAFQPKESSFIENDLLTVYPLYDMHVGMMAWGKETGGQDYDLELFKSDLLRAIETVSARSPASSKALVIFGGDSVHVDDYSNETPASRHRQDADGRFEKIADVAIEAMSHAIESLLERHANVEVVVLRGNHDEASHIILKAAFKQRYRNTERVSFQPCYRDVYWIKHGKSLIFAHHGDKMKPEKLAMIVADQCPYWSDTKYRVALTGHLHSLKVQDFPGVTHYTLRAFAPADAYGSSFGGVRGICAMTFSESSGLTVTAHDPIIR